MNKPDEDDIADAKEINSIVISSLMPATHMISTTLDTFIEHASTDKQYQKLLEKIRNNSFAASFTLEEPLVKEFYKIRDRLRITNELITYTFETNSERLVVPKQLRQQIIKHLHAANQGSTSMLARARRLYYWPGMDRDVESHVMSCSQCRENAPSQKKEPLIATPPPEYPFQSVVADLFEMDNHHYLAYCDRLTAFAELAHFPISTHHTTS